MHFHDCFVRLIHEIKKALEAACPSMVSCADTITLATRDAVALGGGPNYTVPTGRRDGLVSNMKDVTLPGPTFTVSEGFQVFRSKGLTLGDMVTILGAHTVGVAHCSFFEDRVSNFHGTGRPDPTIDRNLAANHSKICASNPNTDPTVFLDQTTGFVFDNEYYKQLLLKRGIMQIDQELASDRSSVGIVSSFARNGIGFKQSFAKATVKLASTQVLVGISGEVRTNCRVFNANKQSKSRSQENSTKGIVIK
ncbi:hypothetical protein P3X46_005326 [Hevea brasiliensis]|uniref:peroxidase n=1 Tax=Hevea brasiliensis TaxID=3981 RepID=A0ABQ9N0T7_HEVBR|nr:hypothetical protein P3X46_005326 [Hevea brasiliensis]